MSEKIQTVAVVFMMLLAATLCLGTLTVFATPLQAQAALIMPVLIAGGALASLLASLVLAPALDARMPRYGTITIARF